MVIKGNVKKKQMEMLGVKNVDFEIKISVIDFIASY